MNRLFFIIFLIPSVCQANWWGWWGQVGVDPLAARWNAYSKMVVDHSVAYQNYVKAHLELEKGKIDNRALRATTNWSLKDAYKERVRAEAKYNSNVEHMKRVVTAKAEKIAVQQQYFTLYPEKNIKPVPAVKPQVRNYAEYELSDGTFFKAYKPYVVDTERGFVIHNPIENGVKVYKKEQITGIIGNKYIMGIDGVARIEATKTIPVAMPLVVEKNLADTPFQEWPLSAKQKWWNYQSRKRN